MRNFKVKRQESEERERKGELSKTPEKKNTNSKNKKSNLRKREYKLRREN